jgi:hypothetical protein
MVQIVLVPVELMSPGSGTKYCPPKEPNPAGAGEIVSGTLIPPEKVTIPARTVDANAASIATRYAARFVQGLMTFLLEFCKDSLTPPWTTPTHFAQLIFSRTKSKTEPYGRLNARQFVENYLRVVWLLHIALVRAIEDVAPMYNHDHDDSLH